MIVSLPQLFPFTVTGAMKSLISEVNAVEERDFTYADENVLQEFCGMIPAQARLIAASPNCCGGRATAGFPPSVSDTVWLLVCPSEQVEEISEPVPQSEPFQLNFVNVGVFDPPKKA